MNSYEHEMWTFLYRIAFLILAIWPLTLWSYGRVSGAVLVGWYCLTTIGVIVVYVRESE